jgi:hypothetical protein
MDIRVAAVPLGDWAELAYLVQHDCGEARDQAFGSLEGGLIAGDDGSVTDCFETLESGTVVGGVEVVQDAGLHEVMSELHEARGVSDGLHPIGNFLRGGVR